MIPIELTDWKTVIATLGGLGLVVMAFKVKFSINLDVNDIVEQIIVYRRQDKQVRFQNECPHVYPIYPNSLGSRPGFRSAFLLEEDGSYECSMCGKTGVTTEDMVVSVEEYWSTRTWKDWGEKMKRRNKITGAK